MGLAVAAAAALIARKDSPKPNSRSPSCLEKQTLSVCLLTTVYVRLSGFNAPYGVLDKCMQVYGVAAYMPA